MSETDDKSRSHDLRDRPRDAFGLTRESTDGLLEGPFAHGEGSAPSEREVDGARHAPAGGTGPEGQPRYDGSEVAPVEAGEELGRLEDRVKRQADPDLSEDA